MIPPPSTSRTGSDKHQCHQDRSGKTRPLVEIHRTESGGRDDRSNLKCCMVKCLKQTRKSPGNIEGDRQDGSRYDRQICQDFRHTGNLLDLFLQNAEVEGKVDTKQDHKRSDDALLQHRIACTPITFYRKSTGTGRTECNAEGIKQRAFC